METVGIKTLKSSLSGFIARAQKGDPIIITDRGEAVAELGPLNLARQAVQALAKHGKLEWNVTKPRGRQGVLVRGGTVADTVLEDRR